ncbi:MAG: hypothetical protein J1D85_00230 [Bacteroidales bacterium]|nr:hypothetical protein [Bacteroidales bacterium]
MKKLFILAAAIAAAASCAKEPVVTESTALVNKTFEASFNALDTKTSLSYESGVYKVLWNAGDEIAVYDDVDPRTPHVFTASGSGASTTFSGQISAGASKFYAVYPADAAIDCNFTDGVISASVPQTQYPEAGNVDGNALVTVSYSESSTFVFRHVCSMLKFTLSGAEDVSEVQIKTNGDQLIAGASSVTYSETPSEVAGSASFVSIKPNGGKTFASGTYYAAILPTEFSGGITVTLFKSEGGAASKSANSALSAPRCAGADLGTLAGWTFGRAIHITSAEELQTLWTSGGCESLGNNDIVYLDTNVELTKGIRSCEDTFNGIFDGQGHTISVTYRGGAKYPAPFKIVTGTIRNLNVEGEFTCLNRTTKDEVRVGGIAGSLNGGIIENCHVNASLGIEDVDNLAMGGQVSQIGGIVAFIQANGGTVQDCSFSGTITCETEKASDGRQIIMGGILGGSGNSTAGMTIIRNCHSEGTIIQRQYFDTWGYVGGIAGRTGAATYLMSGGEGFYNVFDGCSSSMHIRLEGQKTRGGGISATPNGAFLISNCDFSGKITLGATNTGEQCGGGIVGFCETTRNGIIENCTFSGTIDDSDGNNSYNSWLGGICTNGFEANSVIRNCRSTAGCLVVHTREKGSCGLIAGRPNNAITIRDCKVAGTVLSAKNGAVTIDSQAALEANPWVVTGEATTAAVVSINNVYGE